MINQSFSRILTLLRKEQGLSQKAAAQQLGVSQALLSHYEKGIRECGLDFVVKAADFYHVSCDYLLGRTPDRSGATISVEELPDGNAGKENRGIGSLVAVLNKKLLSNSLHIVFSLLQQCRNKALVNEVSAALDLSVYKAFRTLYSANGKNAQNLFAASPRLYQGLADSARSAAEAKAAALAAGETVENEKGVGREDGPALTQESLSADYPQFASSLFNLIQNSETRMGVRRKR